MQLVFSSAFRKKTELDGLTVPLERPMTLKEILKFSARQCAFLKKYTAMEDEAAVSAHLLFVRSGRVLHLSDLIEDGDVVKLLLPVTGG